MNDEAPTPVTPAEERRAMIRWSLAVVAVLLLSSGVQIAFMMIASGDPSSVAEPDYYQKAIAWDATRAQRALNEALGWQAEILASELRSGRRAIEIRLADKEQRPLEGATLSLVTFHKARAAQTLSATLSATETPGVYTTELPLRRPGRWEVRLEAKRGEDRFTLKRDVDI